MSRTRNDVCDDDAAASDRSSFDAWLETQSDHASEDDGKASSEDHRPERADEGDIERFSNMEQQGRPSPDKVIQQLMIACACCFSIGSHYGTYLIGPIKSQLHAGDSKFAALISASQLVNTITPLVAGSLVPKYGAAKCGLVATGVVLVGQMMCVWGEHDGAAPGPFMLWGLGIFGLGLSPLSVVQETVILASRREGSKAVGRATAVGLLLGKLASFVAAATSEPLANLSPRLPFVTAAALSLFSFGTCVAYSFLERRLPRVPPSDHKVSSSEHSQKHGSLVSPEEIATFGDPFWFYVLFCSLAGLWYASIHSSSSLLKTLYNVPSAAFVSSMLLASAVICYPLVGFIVDKRPQSLPSLFRFVTSLMATTFVILLLLAPVFPMPLAIFPLAVGIGPAPLLAVLAVPRIVARHQTSTALGMHKSSEMAGAVIIQAASSYLLNLTPTDNRISAARRVIWLLLILSLSQLCVVIFWWRTVRRRTNSSASDSTPIYDLLPEELDEEDRDDDSDDRGERRRSTRIAPFDMADETTTIRSSQSLSEMRRGFWCLRTFGGFVAMAWIVYFVNLSRDTG